MLGQKPEDLDDFSQHILLAMKNADVTNIDPAVVTFTLVDILSSYCVCTAIPLEIIADLFKDLYAENLRLFNEQRSQPLQ